ncbi:hypothetical protein DEIGR_400108 [Deinococcus grandis]|uniref:Uncharacterized protein n=1 Tax=Deinococcus grandis TaxID=57498 RepID=A0A100HQQ0_9DEIO|nr:hypothetical protein [Deinococcus grandis]GAQ23975.1 hypothetical protein DEIGR_400108 [Deinococcus grandis]
MVERETSKTKYRRRKVTPMPAQVQSPADRGQAFQHWLDSNDYFLTDFARDSAIARSTLSAYISGELDLAAMRQNTAQRLLSTMGLSDTEAWEYFNIPEEHRSTFRTFRADLGHGTELKNVLEWELKVPLQGATTAGTGHSIRVNPNKKLSGLVVMETEDGELFALPADLAKGRGRILGQLMATLYKQPD